MNDLHPVLSRRTGRHHRPYFWRTRVASAFVVASVITVLTLLHLTAFKEVAQ